ncbi:TetR/AcrR family transcriptional regulator [Streptomyces caniscabiei]|uniref:TetR/AcrR family transcriptional regulator n=1 Tax=Streptomyces caniscabiei TaxID=2746961 RepID=A0A927LDS0_9ACTN|nr:TetR/AcrR family transcriptional regulator [Streptomyces caniscabiei]MBD9728919.1 TetR/AcrR family transcriptional regulator [Streptomyces caniscabiei]MDX3514514.1 TetR/AcrR family transcriptional regulator [Streptomyces caniscabiei]MDX3720014.1 TetR/AcrR family transcriptional regulator [Streptomyces caniscabiei]MDX3731008.1 TetR/AcrR family transcriptional regulator [Streptomyces caniscabiei]WEO29128.1 TetR/AcrR family transcriptional regulator [Streptomyces caniscabiei]
MAQEGTPSRERIVAGAADLISRRGLNAASIRNLAKHARAPLGSTYHYFPEGKGQLATEAVRYADAAIARRLGKALDAGPVVGVRAFLALWRGVVLDSEFRAGCPVLAVSVEEPPADEIPSALIAAAEAFDGWERLLADALRDHGVDPERASGLAALVVASVEGAIAMCRAKRGIQPLDQVAEQLEALIAGAVAQRP